MKRYFDPPTLEAILEQGGRSMRLPGIPTHAELASIANPGERLALRIIRQDSCQIIDVSRPDEFEELINRAKLGDVTLAGAFLIHDNAPGWRLMG